MLAKTGFLPLLYIDYVIDKAFDDAGISRFHTVDRSTLDELLEKYLSFKRKLQESTGGGTVLISSTQPNDGIKSVWVHVAPVTKTYTT